jgi:hypothetical protein
MRETERRTSAKALGPSQAPGTFLFMNNVITVQFRKEKSLQCECGCQLFFLMEDHSVVCQECDGFLKNGRWECSTLSDTTPDRAGKHE